MAKVLLQKLFALNAINLEIWARIEPTLNDPVNKLLTLKWKNGYLRWEVDSVYQAFDLASIYETERPKKLFYLEHELTLPEDSCPDFGPIFKQFHMVDFSKPEVIQLLEDWKNFLGSIQVYLGNFEGRFIEEERFKSKILQLLKMEDTDLDFASAVGIQFTQKESIYQHHEFMIDLEYFKKDYSKLNFILEPFTVFYQFQKICSGINVWDSMTKCTHVVTQTESAISASASMDGVCVIREPCYPLEIEVSGGNGDYVIGLVEDTSGPIDSSLGYFFRPNSVSSHRGKTDATRKSYSAFATDEKFIIRYEGTKLIVSGSNQIDTIIYEDIPVKKCMLCLLLNHGPTKVKIID